MPILAGSTSIAVTFGSQALLLAVVNEYHSLGRPGTFNVPFPDLRRCARAHAGLDPEGHGMTKATVVRHPTVKHPQRTPIQLGFGVLVSKITHQTFTPLSGGHAQL